MDIKKVDDKPMVIHTKQKSKLHLHEKKEGQIKGHNTYTSKIDENKPSVSKVDLDDAYIADAVLSPVARTAGNVAKNGTEITKRLIDKTSERIRKNKIKKLDIHKKLAKDKIKRLAKKSAKK